MKLKLKSDFRDMFYDHHFDNEGIPFERFTDGGPNRTDMMKIFKSLGIKTPLYGTYNEFYHKFGYSINKWVVVYSDITKHCGEGKERKLFGQLNDEDKKCPLMEYIETCEPEENAYFSKSTRYLMIGNDFAFVYDYTSKDDWRSNCGEGDISEVLKIKMPEWRKFIDYPLVAIDFVNDNGTMRAIDLNKAPGIHKVGVHKYIEGQDVVNAIKKWIDSFNRKFLLEGFKV